MLCNNNTIFFASILWLFKGTSSNRHLLNKDMEIKRNFLICGFPGFAMDYGANSFPFTNEKLQELKANDQPIWKTNESKPEGLLGCYPSDVLYKINSAGLQMIIDSLLQTYKISDKGEENRKNRHNPSSQDQQHPQH